MPRGGFGGRGFGGRGFGGGGYGMRRVGFPLMGMGMGMGGGGSLLGTLMAGGLGYMMGSNSAQQAAPQAPQPVVAPYQPYPTYPYQGQPATSADNGTLAQLKLLGDLHESGMLTNDEFERQKQKILSS